MTNKFPPIETGPIEYTFLKLLNGHIDTFDTHERSCTMSFDVSTDYCHSVDIVQGGYVTVMLDAVSTHAIVVADAEVTTVSSLEIKVTFLETTRAGKMVAVGKVQKLGRSIAFLTAELFNADGVLTATATTTAKVRR
ncbi:MAG: PaaI family thioesterase [Pseudomonadota bacterium]